MLIWSEELRSFVGSRVPREGLRAALRQASPVIWGLASSHQQQKWTQLLYSFTTSQVSGCTTCSKCVNGFWQWWCIPHTYRGSAEAEGGVFLPACHIKVPVEHLLSKLLSLYSPWKLQMCELISQQVRLHECLIAKERGGHTHTYTYLEEKIRLENVLQIKTVRISKTRKLFYFKGKN